MLPSHGMTDFDTACFPPLPLLAVTRPLIIRGCDRLEMLPPEGNDILAVAALSGGGLLS